MKRNSPVSALLVLAVVLITATLSGFVNTAEASDALLNVKPLKILEVGSLVAADTTFLTDESDTNRTVAIDTRDWDWNAIAQSNLTGGINIAKLYFVSTTATNNGVSDTLYYTIEQGTGLDSLYTYNGSIAAAVGSVALSGGIGGAGAGTACNVWIGTLLADPDSYGANNVWLAPSFRIRFHGDISGTTPKISGLRVYVAYPQRASSR